MKAKLKFKDKVLKILKSIPKGKTLTYKEVARKAGNLNAARAVGMICAQNKDKTIPCHRVIRSNGKAGGYNKLQGKDKKMILRKEGVMIVK